MAILATIAGRGKSISNIDAEQFTIIGVARGAQKGQHPRLAEEGEAIMQTWRADYYDNVTDDEASYSETLEAKNSEDATEKALARPGDWMRVDLTVTILKKPN